MADKDLILVEQGPNPTSDYFVPFALLHEAGWRVRRYPLHETPVGPPARASILIFVRYVSRPWRDWVGAMRERLGRVILLMDDDLLDMAAHRGLPWRYRWKLARLAALHRGWLARQGVELWVASAHLLHTYRAWRPRRVWPIPLATAADPPPNGETQAGGRIFYHGTASHGAEIHWLPPLLKGLLEARRGATFEWVGGRTVRRACAAMAGVRVVPPMGWTAYRSFLRLPGRRIGLAPLVDTPFNRARCHTKFFDITRAGAVGIYADTGPFNEVITHGVDGLLLPMRTSAWRDGILSLLDDDARRRRMLANARDKVARLEVEARAHWWRLLTMGQDDSR